MNHLVCASPIETGRDVKSGNVDVLGILAAAVVTVISCNAAAQVQSTTSSFEYDIAGNLTKLTNPLKQTSTYTYDPLGRRTTATDADGVTSYHHDARDQLIEVKDARNVVTTYTIDGLGNLDQTISGDTGATKNTYDEAGNLKSRVDAKQQKTLYQYDILGRLELVTYADGATVSYQYDVGEYALGRLSKISDSSGTIDYVYDARGRVSRETRVAGGTTFATGYRFDSAGRLAGLDYPSGRAIDYTRDATGQITQITTTQAGATAVLISQVRYEPFGPVRELTFGNGRTQVRTYDIDGRLKSFSLPTHTMALTYDAASRIKAITDAANPGNDSSFDYDPLGRLTYVARQVSTQTYTYDAVGNRKQKVNNSAVTSYTYGAANNRLTHVGAQPIAMDANGSITDKPGASFNYDARGRMVSANTAIGVVTYTINSLGQRIRKVTPTETTVFHYDAGGKLIAEATTAGSTTTTREYVYLGDMPVAVFQ